MFRKILCALMTLCLLMTSMAFAESTAKYPIVDEPITIKAVAWCDTNDDATILWKKVAELTGINIEFKVVPYDQMQVYITMNEWPDFFVHNFDATMIEEYGVQAGWLADISKYMEYMPNLAKTYEEYPDALKLTTASNGAVYTFPKISKAATTANARWHYNYGVLDELGLEIPTTADEYFDVLMAIKNATGEAPLADGFTVVHGYYNWAPGEGYHYAIFGTDTVPNFHDDGTGKVEYGRVGDQYRYYLQFANKLYANGLLHQEYLTMDGATKKARAMAGKTVFGYSGVSSIDDVNVFKNGWSDLRQLAPLTSEYDNTQTLVCSPSVGASGLVINAKSPYIKEICQMLDIFFATEEVAEGTGLYGLAGTYGPEGLTWRYTDETKTAWEYICPPGYEDVYTPTVDFTTKYVSYQQFGRTDDGYFENAVNGPEGNARARALGYVENLNPYQENSLFPQGKMSMTEDENNIVSLYETQIRSHVTEWTAWFITGKKDPNNDADWNEYLKAFDALHLEDLTDAYQSAYDRYLGK